MKAVPARLLLTAFILQRAMCGAERPKAREGQVSAVQLHGKAWKREVMRRAPVAPDWAKPGRWVHHTGNDSLEGMIVERDPWTIAWNDGRRQELSTLQEWNEIATKPLKAQYAPFLDDLQHSMAHYKDKMGKHIAAGSGAHRANQNATHAGYEYMDDLQNLAIYSGVGYNHMKLTHANVLDGIKFTLKEAKHKARMDSQHRSDSKYSIHKEWQQKQREEIERERQERYRREGIPTS